MACQYLRSSYLTPLRTEIRCGAAGLSTHTKECCVVACASAAAGISFLVEEESFMLILAEARMSTRCRPSRSREADADHTKRPVAVCQLPRANTHDGDRPAPIGRTPSSVL